MQIFTLPTRTTNDGETNAAAGLSFKMLAGKKSIVLSTGCFFIDSSKSILVEKWVDTLLLGHPVVRSMYVVPTFTKRESVHYNQEGWSPIFRSLS